MRSLRPPKSRVPLAGVIASGSLAAFANAVAAIAYPWLVYDLTGSAAWMGIIATAAIGPLVVGTFFGSLLVDRFGARPIALIGDTVGALTAIAIAALASLDLLTRELLLALVFLGALLDGPSAVAHEVRLPEIARLARMPLLRANVIDDILDNGAAVVGPAVAGLLVATLSTESAFWAIAVIAIACALLTALTVPAFRPGAARLRANLRSSFEGPLFIWKTSLLRHALLLAALGIGVFVAVESVVLPAALRAEGRSATELGLFLATAGASAIAINVVLALLKAMPPLRPLFASAFVGLALSVGLLAFDRSTIALIAGGILLGLSAGPLTPTFATLLQTIPPKAIRARVLGASTSLVLAAAPAATLLAGASMEAFGARPVLIAAAALLAAGAVLALGMPRHTAPAATERDAASRPA